MPGVATSIDAAWLVALKYFAGLHVHARNPCSVQCTLIHGCTGAVGPGAAAKRAALVAWACSSIPSEGLKLQVRGALFVQVLVQAQSNYHPSTQTCSPVNS